RPAASEREKSADIGRDKNKKCQQDNIQPVHLAKIDRHGTSPLLSLSLAQTRDAGHPRLQTLPPERKRVPTFRHHALYLPSPYRTSHVEHPDPYRSPGSHARP